MRAGLARAVAAAVVVAAAAGCYAPSPPPGAYRCSEADNSCPSGQHCTCGLCVKSDDQAACAFNVAASLPQGGVVNEHDQFPLTITALRADKSTMAGGFNGTVTLTSSWGDITPSTVELVGGQAMQMVSLNRETLPPQTATITVSFAGNSGAVGKIGVKAPPFVRDPMATVAPPSGTDTFGWADTLVAEPDVLIDATGQYRMYFGGVSTGKQFQGYNFGVATSTDGVHFSPAPVPVYQAPTQPGTMNKYQINSPTAFAVGDSWYLAYSQGTNGVVNDQDILLAGASPDGMMAFPAIGPVVQRSDCAYCNGTVELPSVIPDPSGSGYIMFFSAIYKDPVSGNTTANIGRASADATGTHFVPEPAPILSSDLTGEAVLFAPRVIVDGTVFKMWYSYARAQDIKDLQNLCNSGNKVQIGYATSDDGFYWIRSPNNPAVAVGGSGWDADSPALLSGSVVPLDGKSTQSGFAVYYTTFRTVTIFGVPVCLPSGIGRATRP